MSGQGQRDAGGADPARRAAYDRSRPPARDPHRTVPDIRAGPLHTLAMADRARRERLRDVLAEIRAQLGPATDEETAWARSVLGL
ncbi:MAG: hypothetical protein ACRDRY_10455 [Pseudonocardiaceae bacterium]